MAIFNITTGAKVNLPPSQIGDVTVNLLDPAVDYIFTIDNFTTETNPEYVDPEGDALIRVKVKTLPATGVLKVNTTPISAPHEVTRAIITSNLFTYTPDPLGEYVDTFTFDLSDEGSGLYSGLTGVFTLNVDADINLPPTVVGDGEVTTDYGDTTVFSRLLFTSLTTPPYSDPEGDAAYLLKVLTLPATGVLKLDGVDVVVNQEILFTDIDAGLLTHVPDLGDTDGNIQPFEFEIADEGSGIFVG